MEGICHQHDSPVQLDGDMFLNWFCMSPEMVETVESPVFEHYIIPEKVVVPVRSTTKRGEAKKGMLVAVPEDQGYGGHCSYLHAHN